MTAPLLEVENLRVEFQTQNGIAKAIDGLSFTVGAGEVLGIVGESGCGKSMTALSILGLIPSPPGRIANGAIRLNGRDLVGLDNNAMRSIRGGEVSMVFQEPMTSLNPLYTVGEQIAETIITHMKTDKKEARKRALDMLRSVGIPAPEQRIDEFPHQLSGGMRQRVMIAIALACRPSLLICDEPTTALDVTVQAQVLDLLRGLRDEFGTAIILITHDMGVISEMADRVLVMYAGRKVENASTRDIIDNPQHPYTRGLIECVPRLGAVTAAGRERLVEIPGIVPALTSLGQGCAFAPRCNRAMDRCANEAPPDFAVSSMHAAACWAVAEDHTS